MEGVTQGRGQHEKRLGGQNPGPRAAHKGSAWPRPEKPLVVEFCHSSSHAGQTCLCCVRYFLPIKLRDGPFRTMEWNGMERELGLGARQTWV